jgi:hypothetical protein
MKNKNNTTWAMPHQPTPPFATPWASFFFKKRVKKLKFEKGVAAENISKNGCLPPNKRAG